jgi:large subunit ribosomal protein L23
MSRNTLHQVLKRPLITEKANDLKDLANQVAFEVSIDSNKLEIRRAVETIFNVEVSDVNTLVVRGKKKRVGRRIGRRPNWKKAIVTLKSGQDIDFFEGV